MLLQFLGPLFRFGSHPPSRFHRAFSDNRSLKQGVHEILQGPIGTPRTHRLALGQGLSSTPPL